MFTNNISSFSFGKILGGVSKVLGIANQLIPIYNQAKPVINNSKKILGALKDIAPVKNSNINNNPKISNSTKNKKTDNNNLPVFFS